jgi:prepilin-type N-terminal cleavage/methylation domain-containing protein
MKNQNNKLAFSLIELSVVILVIGILVIGITKGSRIIAESKIKSAVALTQASPVGSTEGLVLWLDSVDKYNIASGTVASNSYGNIGDSDSVVIWRDRNPHSNIKIAPTALLDANRPTYEDNGINGLPSITFDGGLQFLQSSTAVPLAARDNTFTFICVYAVGASGLTDTQVLFGQGLSTSTAGNHVGLALFNPSFGFFGYGDYLPLVRSTLKAGQNHITTIRANAYKNDITIFHDSNNDTTNVGNTGLGIANLNVGTTYFRVGTSANDTGGQYNFNGLMSELIIFNRPLKTLEITAIHNYLSAKYNIKLS